MLVEQKCNVHTNGIVFRIIENDAGIECSIYPIPTIFYACTHTHTAIHFSCDPFAVVEQDTHDMALI